MQNNQIKNLVVLAVILLSLLVSCKSAHQPTIHQKIATHTDEIFDSLVEVRRDFHRFPELAGKENRTAKKIADYLNNLGLEVKTNVAGHGVIGILKGAKAGKTVAWRADMDALPHDFPDEVTFKSEHQGVQHGCGHDVHMAIALGIANVLSKNKASIEGTVYFIFQPKEETFVGAQQIVNSSDYSKMAIDEIYALHVTALPVGQIMVKPEELYAYQNRIQFRFNKELSKEDAATLYKEIRTKTLRIKDSATPWQIPLAFDAEHGLTNPDTMFKDYLYLEENYIIREADNAFFIEADAYETNKLNIAHILPEIEQIIQASKHKDKFIATTFVQQNPTVLNHRALTKKAMNTLTAIYGEDAVVKSYAQIPYFNDDFIYFQRKTPGVYFLFGGSNPEKGLSALNHTPNFRVDEDCIKIGVKSFSSLLLEHLSSN